MRADVQVCICSFRAGVQAILRGSVIWRFKSQELSYEIVRQKRICDLGFLLRCKSYIGGKDVRSYAFRAVGLIVHHIVHFLVFTSPVCTSPFSELQSLGEKAYAKQMRHRLKVEFSMLAWPTSASGLRFPNFRQKL